LKLLAHHRPLAFGSSTGRTVAAVAGQSHEQGDLVGARLRVLLLTQCQPPELRFGIRLQREGQELVNIQPETAATALAGLLLRRTQNNPSAAFIILKTATVVAIAVANVPVTGCSQCAFTG
jgi:hypothetical protein